MSWSDFAWGGGWAFLIMIGAMILMVALCAGVMRCRRGRHFMAWHPCCGHPSGGTGAPRAATPRRGGARHAMTPSPGR